VEFTEALQPARFVRRDNRFRVTVAMGGQHVAAHLPNSGRLGELLTPGRPVWLRPASSQARRTGHDLSLVEYAGTLVSVDARLPNRLLHEALLAARLPALRAYSDIRRESHRGDSRLDFLLQGASGERCWLETKSVTLVEEGVALFPDAPTARGRRHLVELQKAIAAGERAAVVFVVQRCDARAFSPHPTADPAFSQTLSEAHASGVMVWAYDCEVSVSSVTLRGPLPVRLSA
jgi:sugar fermentation stimulation protein A